METKVCGYEGIDEASEIIRAGGLVAFPTETVYGLGGNAFDSEASRKIYDAKGRPSDNPLIVHVSSIEEVESVALNIPEKAEELMKSFWPGPLTIVLKKRDSVPFETTGGLSTVAVRCPDNQLTLEFIRKCGLPIAGPSANISGKPSPTRADHVLNDLSGKIEMILDGGDSGVGVESTIVDMSSGSPMLLRPGAITVSDMEQVIGEKIETDPGIEGTAVRPKAPGMKYRHYAPNAKMIMVTTEGFREKGYDLPEEEYRAEEEKVMLYIKRKLSGREKAGVLCSQETLHFFSGSDLNVKVLGSRKEPLSMTHRLFSLLREFDMEGTEFIYTEKFSEKGVGFALMNRLKKAAGGCEELAENQL